MEAVRPWQLATEALVAYLLLTLQQRGLEPDEEIVREWAEQELTQITGRCLPGIRVSSSIPHPGYSVRVDVAA